MSPRLKMLELQGYKTFAGRTVMEYPADITAIVGPNGAGKSNVADAIRWVLGEQSYSLLRGRKTEDMIFAGSEQRPRASMASVTITFDNEDGWLPIDYAEVSVTRRAYRDGTNEYLLNGQRVRLKEISELLAQSGLAERTYTIIGQGLVDMALSLRPDERRRFFEEAAGIGLYRSRRDEALNRLEATQRNLERVQDILGELEPRLASLERQARRAQEYERIKSDLQLLLRDWYGYHWHRSQQEIIRAKEALRAQENRYESTRKQLAQVEEKLNGARGRLQVLREQLNLWHGQMAELYRRREKVSRDLAIMEERQHSFNEQRQNFQSELVRLEEEMAARQERVQQTEVECQRLRIELGEAQSQVRQATRALEERQCQRKRVETELEEIRSERLRNEKHLAELNARRGELTNRLDGLRSSQVSLERSLVEEKQLYQKAQDSMKAAEQEQEQREANLAIIEADLKVARRELDTLEKQRASVQEHISQLETRSSRLTAQLQVLEQAEKSFSGLNQGAKFVLENARRGNLPGAYQILSSQLEVSEEIEIAIAAALGEFLDGVLLQGQTDPEPVLLMLESGEKGRAVLVPVQSNFSPVRLDVPSEEGILGCAAELVKSPNWLQPVLWQLLGEVILVRNRAVARRLAKELPSTARAVTLRGEVFWGNGVVVAGREGREGLVGRPRQKRELQEAIAAVTHELEQAGAQKREVEKKIAAQRSRVAMLVEKLTSARKFQQEAVHIIQKKSLELEQARQRQDWQRRQLNSIETQIQQTDDELKQVTEGQRGLEEEIARLDGEIQERQHVLSTSALDELQTAVAHWHTNAAVAERALKDAEHRLSEYRQTLESDRQLHASLLQRLGMVETGLQTIEAERQMLRNLEKELNNEVEGLSLKLEPAEDELEKLEKQYTFFQQEQVTAQQAVTVAERYVAQAQLDLNRQRELLDSLRRRIEDDFGLVSFETTPGSPTQAPLPLGSMVEQLPALVELPPELEDNINRQRS
ncbi:MAG: chromosome segregation protein SMC, partial [Anaerolineales bacterium]